MLAADIWCEALPERREASKKSARAFFNSPLRFASSPRRGGGGEICARAQNSCCLLEGTASRDGRPLAPIQVGKCGNSRLSVDSADARPSARRSRRDSATMSLATCNPTPSGHVAEGMSRSLGTAPPASSAWRTAYARAATDQSPDASALAARARRLTAPASLWALLAA
eukprot:scaffold153720_cov31-Tisochrysis_lutea.AAC.1